MRQPFSTPPGSVRRKVALLMLLGMAGGLAGCQTDGAPPPNPFAALSSPAPKEEPAKPSEPPMTRSRAASECWMSTEKGRADANLDKRADFVTKCIDEKMKKAAAAPKT